MRKIGFYLSPCRSSCRLRPSNETQDVFRLSGEIEICERIKNEDSKLEVILFTFSSTPAGTTIGRKLSECGQIGVTIIAGTEGSVRGKIVI